MSALTGIALAVGCAAIIDDLVRRRISNWIPLLALVSGVAVHSFESGWRGSLSSVAGAFAGGGVFLIFYVLGGLGGGDIKLMTGFGAVLGTARILEAALWTAACGGLIAAAVIAVGAARRGWNKSRGCAASNDVERTPGVESIPYAPAIALGAWLSLISHMPSTRGLG